MIEEKVFLGRDNTVDLEFLEDKVPINFAAITRVTVTEKNNAWTIDSDISVDAFEWQAGSGLLKMRFGEETIEPGTYVCNVFLHDSINTLGIFWKRIKLHFVDLSL